MTCPVQFVAALGSRNISPIQIDIHIFSDFIVLEFYKTVPNWCTLLLVSDELDTGDARVRLEQALDVGVVHPRLNITNPESFGVELLCLLICKTLT